MSFKPLVREPVYQQVADQIAEAILAGELPAGQPLPTERDLSEQFDVSRASIREALRALQARGLVVSSGSRTRPLRVTPAAGASGPLREALLNLVRLQEVGLADLIDVRCALETAALERAAEGADPARLEEARQALVEMRRSDLSVEEFDEADVRFHLALIAASGNRAMHLVMLALRDAMTKHLHESLRMLPRPAEAFHQLADQHAAILQAVEAGDGEAARTLVQEHIVRFYERFVSPDGEGSDRPAAR
jgi:GntR family transcriptional repressor for pyruvate dehydrogenase complex